MLKKDLRLDFLAMRDLLSHEERRKLNRSIFNHLKTLPIWDYDYYHLFLPIEEKNEVDTGPVIDLLRQAEKYIVVPKVINETELEHILLEETTDINLSPWGIPEPVSGKQVPVDRIDLVLVPLLVFDKSGHRVGYGKGYYDRFLTRCRSDAVKVGLSYFDPIDKISDVAAGDVVLDYCISPSAIYSFSG